MKRSMFGPIAGTLALAACLMAAEGAQAPAKAAVAKAAASRAPSDPGEDRRPFGKYLVKVCELGRGCYDPSKACDKPSCGPEAEALKKTDTNTAGSKKAGSKKTDTKKTDSPKTDPEKCTFCNSAKKPQSIAVKQAGCDGTVVSCNAKAEYPLPAGHAFYIEASSDAGLPVTLSVKGPAVETGKTVGGIQAYVVTGEGAITVKAEQKGDGTHLAAPSATMALQTADSPSPDCYGLYTGPVVNTDQPDIAAIAALAGNPVPFVLTTQGTGTILIYATRWPFQNRPDEAEILNTVVATLDGPLGSDPGKSFGVKAPAAKPVAFQVELGIAHAAALGDPAGRITALGYSKFTVQNIGSTPGKVRITAAEAPGCKDWKTFLSAVRELEWGLVSQPSVTKLWYLNSDDTSKAMNGLFGSSGGSGSASGSGSGTGSGSGAASGSGSGGGAGSGTAASGGSSAAASPNATISVSQPPGSKVEIKTDTTPCVVAGLAFGNSNACAPAGSGASSGSGTAAGGASGGGASGTNPVAAVKTISMGSIGAPSSTPQAGQLPQSPPDMVIFGNPTPGDDAQIAERNRILAQLDLPRPEMIINAWVMQNSTSDPRAMGEFSQEVRTMVERYNESLERLVLDSYRNVSEQMLQADYFNEGFYHYISDRFVAEGNKETPTAQSFLDRSPARLADSAEERTNRLGICKEGRYCLGYSWLFNPSKPRLTDLLLALIAAKEPVDRVMETVNKVQGTGPNGSMPALACTSLRGEESSRCMTIEERLDLREEKEVTDYLDPNADCTTADEWGILRSQFTGLNSATDWHPRMHLVCFARAARLYLREAGLARAAVADFLFQCKRSQQYPHEFSGYYLNQSATNLNSALSPMIEAFNRDVVAFQTYMRTDIEYEVEVANRGKDRRCCVKRLFGIGKPSFFNDGIVSVRTISGQAAQVNATSQSYLDASKAPSLSDLMAAIGSGATPGSASPLASVLGAAATQAPVSLLSGVLGSYQKTTAQIGRQLQLQVVPRSLATASSAEISVYMKAANPATTPVFTGGPPSAQQQNTSEVSNHEVTTRIRVDSVKLFELSSYSAVLQRSRSKIPLLPPFVEIPYIGTILGIPLPAAKEYHASTAIVSAMVVPTAADIGYGLRFLDDLVLYGPPGPCSFAGQPGAPLCRVRRALSVSDLHASVATYHDAMVLCFTTEAAPGRAGTKSGEESLAPATTTGRGLFIMRTTPQQVPQEKLPAAGSPAGKDVCRDLTFLQLPSYE